MTHLLAKMRAARSEGKKSYISRGVLYIENMKIDSLDSEYQTAAQPASSTKVNNSSKDDQQMFNTNNPYVLPLQSTQTD